MIVTKTPSDGPRGGGGEGPPVAKAAGRAAACPIRYACAHNRGSQQTKGPRAGRGVRQQGKRLQGIGGANHTHSTTNGSASPKSGARVKRPGSRNGPSSNRRQALSNKQSGPGGKTIKRNNIDLPPAAPPTRFWLRNNTYVDLAVPYQKIRVPFDPDEDPSELTDDEKQTVVAEAGHPRRKS
jgi:hypothetical protein